MRKATILFLSYIFALVINAQDNLSALMPYPNSVVQGNGFFAVSKQTSVSVNSPGLDFAASMLKDAVKNQMRITLGQTSDKGTIQLLIDNNIQGDEHYILNISSKGISIKGKTAGAVLYGVITLNQLMLGDAANTPYKRIRSVTIDDEPAMSFRALMLEPARNFIPVKDVKSYIDQMLKFKYNTLQIHLTDDQGWRVEIKSHPKLTEIGAFRNPKKDAGAPHNGFYTQEDLREIVRYAAQRNIQVIPEIDIPGHTVAMLAAYPDLRCDIMKDSIFDINKTTNMMLSAANPKVYKVLNDVIREVSSIFPSKTIHLGGDESAIESNWAKSPENLELMRKHNYTKPEQLMNVFFGNVLTSVRKHGMKAILWCELDNIRMPANEYLFDYQADVTLVTWRMGLTPKCIELTAKNNHPLILAPGEFCYLDYPQYKNDLPEFNNWGMPVTTLEKTYQFDPTYNLPENERQHIIGVMGTLWGEAIQDINRVNYMTWPRGLALAEAGWTKMKYRIWNSFLQRMYPNLSELMKAGVSFRVPFEVAP